MNRVAGLIKRQKYFLPEACQTGWAGLTKRCRLTRNTRLTKGTRLTRHAGQAANKFFYLSIIY